MKSLGTLTMIVLLASTMALAATDMDPSIDALLQRMTLTEKVGQMTQYSYGMTVTGPTGKPIDQEAEIRNGRVGSLLNATGAEQTRMLQTIAVDESHLGIPLIFGLDVVHGYRTIFPLPLAEAASWDLEIIEQAARVAAIEASAAGVHWTFAPMVDIARDPRWGRVMEGAGEDPYFGARVAVARVKGFQGSDLSRADTILACTKHFAAYGAAQAGRDYHTVDISQRTLHEIYLPPFRATVEAGVGSFMSAFNEINGIPCTGNPALMRTLLKQQWGFDGFVVSDWDSVREMMTHGFAADRAHATALAAKAGTDMDMMSAAYIEHLATLVKQGEVDIALIDDAVRRILRIKHRLGLFADPYRYCNARREKEVLLHARHQKIAREVARKSIVLLKNDQQLLPLRKDIKTLALIGPLADSADDLIGSWSAKGEAGDCVTLKQGIEQAVSDSTRLLYAPGCPISDKDPAMMAEALRIARRADVIIAALGESKDMSGEAKCRAHIGLPGQQLHLLKQLHATGKPIVLVLMNGRPLTLAWEASHIPAILETWLLGNQGGPAIADCLFGAYNPSGKLPVTFPYALGQVPIFYNHKNTGRPPVKDQAYRSTYLDIPFEPLFPFGFGLSYTTFTYGDIQLSQTQIGLDDTLTVSVQLSNTGTYAGEEVVQLYIRDLQASVTRPVKELKGFQKLALQPGAETTVRFTLSSADLAFLDRDLNPIVEPGRFEVYVGGNSRDAKKAEFALSR